MLGGGNPDITIANGSGKGGVDNLLHSGWNRWSGIKVTAVKTDPAVFRCRFNRQVYGPAGMKADAATTDSSF